MSKPNYFVEQEKEQNLDAQNKTNVAKGDTDVVKRIVKHQYTNENVKAYEVKETENGKFNMGLQ